MFYAKLPNSLYVDKNNKNDYKGTKQMKDKSRMTEMIATAADISRLPVKTIGKPKRLEGTNVSGTPYQSEM